MIGIINYILDLGASIFLPIIIILLGVSVRMKFKDALSSGITLGIAFISMNLILTFLFNTISPVVNRFVDNTGLQLSTIDVGWSPLATMSWAWPYAVGILLMQIIINIVMLCCKMTDCLNLDIWNVWNKILTAIICTVVSRSVVVGLIAAAIQVVLELKNADLTKKRVQELSGIDGVGCPHSIMLQMMFLAPINRVLDIVLGKKSGEVDVDQMRKKLGFLGEAHIIGFLVGCGISFFAGDSLKDIVTTGLSIAASMVLFPKVAEMFSNALSPIAAKASVHLKEKFKGREFFIGLDWPFMGGRSEIWIIASILVPIQIIWAVVLGHLGLNKVMPIGGIINCNLAVAALVMSRGNIIKMFIMSVIMTPAYLLVSTFFAPVFTQFANTMGTLNLEGGQLISWFSLEAPLLRYLMSFASRIINGETVGIIALVTLIGIYIHYYRYMKKNA